ncbi:ATP-binding protein [Natranaerobius trueperi]|uniref:Histidine kinase/HSP90-like ATPase domain-containing protein n=1 Tax=Natranaerobius trueperi TaxID=759412 RepID=A0A226C2L6_9FIRM|nr:ATP-binding protein [Natranaerobius trueperi]OWZ84647.1 hypothetical protein CDO51_02485 [Natranaerobius trueperi]
MNITLNTHKKIAEEKGIDCNFGIKDDLNEWYFKSWDLNAIVGNPLNNSFESVLKNNGEKYVSIELLVNEHGHNQINVINNGPMITQREKEAIFESGYTTKGNGRGYGLYI